MNDWFRELLAGLVAAGMSSGAAIVAILQETPLSGITDGQWVAIGIMGFLAAGAGWLTLLTKQPERYRR